MPESPTPNADSILSALDANQDGKIDFADILAILTRGWSQTEAAIVTAVSSWKVTELVALGLEVIEKCWQSLRSFVDAVRGGMGWGEAMANLLTDVWNGVKETAAKIALSFVAAVGKVFQNVGLLPA